MLKPATKIEPPSALYIKLGRSGSWEKECLENGILRFGYKETFDSAASGDWKAVYEHWRAVRQGAGAAHRDVRQIRFYFDTGQDTPWITFYDGRLWWCFTKVGVKQHHDGEGSYRETVSGWHDADIKGTKLTFENLSGSLLKMQAFQGTICAVGEFEYLKRKLDGLSLPQVDDAVDAKNQIVQKIVPLMHLLTWQDFELLVDLVFANSGWRRVGQVGKTQKTVDIVLMLPTTGERAFVQIKARAERGVLDEYAVRLNDSGAYDRMFFVWHTGDVGEVKEKNVELVGPERLAQWIFDAGLTTWLLKKVS